MRSINARMDYEIRLLDSSSLNSSSRASLIYVTAQDNDDAAIQYARRLTQDDQGIEVWRGMALIYEDRPARAGSPSSDA